MRFSSSVLLLAATGLAAQVSGAFIYAAHDIMKDVEDPISLRDINHRRRHPKRHNRSKGGGNGAASNPTCLAADAVQTGSSATGQNGDATAGQVDSDTDEANFINFCSGETLTNGLQNKGGSCNGVVMGKIPSTSSMVSSMIISPKPGQVLEPLTTFKIDVQTQGLAPGAFTNAASTYYSAPQNLNKKGQIIGHTHVTVQDMGKSLTPKTSLDPTNFAFFTGINDDGNGKGLLSAAVPGGLPEGFYRVCTMSSSANHQPVLMPVAQRGAQDDCTKFQVKASSSAGGGNKKGNTNGDKASIGNKANTGGGDTDPEVSPAGDSATSTSDVEEATSTAASNNGNAAGISTAANHRGGCGRGRGVRGGRGGGRGESASSVAGDATSTLTAVEAASTSAATGHAE